MQTSAERSSKQQYKEFAKFRFSDKLIILSIRLFGNIASILEGKMQNIGDEILRSNLFITPYGFLSLILFIAFLSIPISIFGAYMLLNGYIMFSILIPTPLYIIAIGYLIPKLSATNRASSLDGEIIFVVGYLSVVISSGISPIILFRKLSNSKLYPATSKEIRRILTFIDIFNINPITAIERVARYCPSKIFAEFLNGYTSVVRVGGNINSYMLMKQKEVINSRIIKLKSTIETIGTLAEGYIAATVVLGLSLFILQSVQAIISQTTINLDMIMVYSFLFIPFISVVSIYIINALQTKEPVNYMLPHYLFGIGLVAIPLFYYLPLDMPIYIKIGIGLALSTTAAAITNLTYTKKKQAIENMLPNFIADLTEVRKTGLSIEKGMQILAKRNYGIFTKTISRMANQLSWGVPMTKIIHDFGRDVNSWFAKAIGSILSEIIESGGGTSTLFSNLTEFTQRCKELDKERRSMLKMYIFLPYFGAILNIVTVIAIIGMITEQLSDLSEQTNTNITLSNNTDIIKDTMLTAAIFQSWIMGLVAGKMGEWSLAAGYKHATILTVINIITIFLANTITIGI